MDLNFISTPSINVFVENDGKRKHSLRLEYDIGEAFQRVNNCLQFGWELVENENSVYYPRYRVLRKKKDYVTYSFIAIPNNSQCLITCRCRIEGLSEQEAMSYIDECMLLAYKQLDKLTALTI